jgi:site-specific DNA-cytosine methylase
MYRQMGNSVAVPVVSAVATEITKTFNSFGEINKRKKNS